MEQRLRALDNRLNQIDQNLRGEITTQIRRVSRSASDGSTSEINDHLAAVDPHPQYLTQAEADLLYILVNPSFKVGFAPVREVIASETIPVDHQLLLYNRVEVTGTLTIEGTLVVL